MKANYHTHMYLCRHAIGTVSDYAESAIANGLSILGMSDHAPFEELKDRSVRMYPQELPTYLEECDRAIEKYAGQLKIYKGLEIEYFEGHDEMYRELLSKLDYLILGQHYIPTPEGRNGLKSCYGLAKESDLDIYAETVIKAMASGYFKMVCHPDLMFFAFPVFSDAARRASIKLIDASVKYHIPLEINANGIRRGFFPSPDGPRYLYPREEFWILAKERNASVIISSDAHEPNLLFDQAVLDAYQFAARLGIEVAEAIQF